MGLLSDHQWKSKYTPDDGDLVEQFYVRALESAVRYDRSTGYFTAPALTLAARGIEALVRNQGRMRMLVGCTLNEDEAQAIIRGENLRETAAASLLKMPLVPPDAKAHEALELLSWMVAKGFLEVKVAIPCDKNRHPVPGVGLFHEKAGVIEDKTGDRLAFSGSVNETAHGWKYNWESFHVFCSWKGGVEHIEAEEKSFATLWSDQSPRAMVFDVPEAVKKALMRFLPSSDQPARLQNPPKEDPDASVDTSPDDGFTLKPHPAQALLPLQVNADERREAVWRFIHTAPLRSDGERMGEATSAITPWPHQMRAFHRMYDHWPPKLLIADEVGLGKTIEVGLLIRQAWLSGKAKRILILAPKAVLKQWQVELREKFNLNWPIYDGHELAWYPSRALRGKTPREVSRDDWHKELFVIASSHLMRRRERQAELLEASKPWDLVILDEAHHARRKSPGQASEGGPNLLLRLMQGLKTRTQGLVLMTATPMQVHPIEVWDLLGLLGMPQEWNVKAFLEYFPLAGKPNPSHEEFDALAKLFQATERSFGAVDLEAAVKNTPGNSRIKARRILAALRDSANTPRRQLESTDRKAALALLNTHTPVSTLISRHTRDLLRQYFKLGKLKTPIATRRVDDQFLPMSTAEREVYEAVEDYISSTYNNAAADERTSVGFVMTIYRRRLASSFQALKNTLSDRLEGMGKLSDQRVLKFGAGRPEEDLTDDETSDEVMDTDQAVELERKALDFEEKGDIERLLAMVARLPSDTKAKRLEAVIGGLVKAGHKQVIVFTQYTDTLDYLRGLLVSTGRKILCYSGRGGEYLDASANWRTISREETQRRFRNGDADILLATDAAAEGLNFQFCGALVNFDSPWNPMRIEQRIGRIDRLGQQFPEIRIVNLMYEDTVETDVYRALRTRIGLFTAVVGKLQPILASLPRRIADATLAPATERAAVRDRLIGSLDAAVTEAESGFDIDEATAAALEEPTRAEPPYTLDDLSLLLQRPELLPAGITVQQLGSQEFSYRAPDQLDPIRVTTDPDFYQENPESTEFWTPGNPLFPAPPDDMELSDHDSASRLGDLL
ncbi:MAG: helicase [Acidobacteria bacterium RIFCSPLOWO2_02_FULL_59_13]|nr:MAG: helicase [Acidobacteria bacterium RIFCSPLOWO2_02_FULL_59_13]